MASEVKPMMKALKAVREKNDAGRQALQAWADSKTRPAPAATDTGLVTVGYLTGSSFAPLKERGSTLLLRDSPNEWPEKYKGSHALVTRSQAEELLAAERAKTERWHKKAMDAGVITHSDGTTSHPIRKELDDLKADNAAHAARIKELEADLKTYQDGTTDLVNEKIDAEFKVIDLEAKLATANALVTCCCGDLVDAHNMGSGHSPVDQYHYAMMQLEAKLSAADTDAIGYRSTIEHLTQRAETAENKLAAAEKALEFYANTDNWKNSRFEQAEGGTVLQHYPSSAHKDRGATARAVLGGKPS